MLAGHYFTFPAAGFIVVLIPGLPPGPSLAFSHGEACVGIIQSNPYWSGAFSVWRRLSIHRSKSVVRLLFMGIKPNEENKTETKIVKTVGLLWILVELQEAENYNMHC